MLLTEPNLDVIVPVIGFIRLIPRDAVDLDIFLDVENPDAFPLPFDDTFDVLFVDATFVIGCSTFFSSYKFEIASSALEKSAKAVSYFSIICISSQFSLFFSFRPLTTSSAVEKSDTLNFSSLSSNIA